MSDLGEVLGTLLSSLAHARRIADEEVTAIAEYYKDNPLLEGMSLPRVRVPELIIDLPVLIKTVEQGEPDQAEDPNQIVTEVKKALLKVSEEEEITIPQGFIQGFSKEFKRDLDRAPAPTSNQPWRRVVPRETSKRSAEKAVIKAAKRHRTPTPLTNEQVKLFIDAARLASDQKSVSTSGKPPQISASILTGEVKEGADPMNVARIRLTMREEGLEWQVSGDEDGSKGRLSPE